MRRCLPRKLNFRRKIILLACQDFYNELNKSAKKIALYLMGRKKGIELTEEEKGDLEHIKQNLRDKVYLKEIENESRRQTLN